MSLSLDDGVHILRVDHAQHPVTEHARCCGLHHDEGQGEEAADMNFLLEMQVVSCSQFSIRAGQYISLLISD